jgi:hypothetical protein
MMLQLKVGDCIVWKNENIERREERERERKRIEVVDGEMEGEQGWEGERSRERGWRGNAA